MISTDFGSGITSHRSGLGICARPLLELPWLRHVVTSRNYSQPDASRKEELLGLKKLVGTETSTLVHGEQKHTDHVAVVRDTDIANASTAGYFKYPETDALICAKPNVTLAIMTADCAPIFLVDTQKEVIGLVHAGWKGTLADISGKAVETMLEMGCQAQDIVAWVGPMAGGCCYEVSVELMEIFANQYPQWNIVGKGTRHLDLPAINCKQLRNAGLPDAHVINSNICTIHNCDSFYSYRADNGTHGRILSAMCMIA